jgi:hypothetical protein
MTVEAPTSLMWRRTGGVCAAGQAGASRSVTPPPVVQQIPHVVAVSGHRGTISYDQIGRDNHHSFEPVGPLYLGSGGVLFGTTVSGGLQGTEMSSPAPAILPQRAEWVGVELILENQVASAPLIFGY